MRRQPGLDLLRAIAIAWVMLYHASLFELAPDDWAVVAFGWMGVDLFFVLSGFLIAGQLLQPLAQGESPDYVRFFRRRVLRTLPAFLAILAVCFLLPEWRERRVIQPLWQFLTFTQNLFIRLDTPKAFSHAWSLCVEEQFYLVLPLLLMLFRRRANGTKVAVALVSVCIAGMLLRGVLWAEVVARPRGDLLGTPDIPAFFVWIYYPTWSRLDGLLAGVTLALIRWFRPAWWRWLEGRSGWTTLAGLAGLGGTILFFGGQVAHFWPAVLGYPMLAISLSLLVAVSAMPDSLLGRLRIPGVQALAIGAYSLYLSHKLVFHAVQAGAAEYGYGGPIVPLAAFGLALAIGALLYFCVERPFLLMRDRIGTRAESLRAA